MRAPSIARERDAWSRGLLLVGLDEVGRGPLAGPVVAAAIAFAPNAPRIRGLRDSKTLPPARRATLAARVRDRAVLIGIGAASVRLIDRVNIRVATSIAMRRALARAFGGHLLPAVPHRVLVLVDGLPFPELGLDHESLVDADALCYSVSAAAVLAKTVRDRLMIRLALRHPGYGWESNMGYATADHLAGIQVHGPTRHHRLSFTPVTQLDLGLRT